LSSYDSREVGSVFLGKILREKNEKERERGMLREVESERERVKIK
jgi:hypothetical protein